MSHVTLELPKTLHQQLNNIAQYEGTSVNQYIIYALSRYVAYEYIAQPVDSFNYSQESSFKKLLKDLGQNSIEEAKSVLDERIDESPEKELTSEIIQKLNKKIKAI